MSEDEVYELLQAAGVIVDGHFVFNAGAHAPTKVIFRNLITRPENAAHLTRLCQAFVYRVMFETAVHDLSFDCLCGVHFGGQAIAELIAPLLREALDQPLPVILNRKLEDGKSFELTSPAADYAGCSRALMIEDVVTTGGSSERLRSLIKTVGVDCVALFVGANREERDAAALGVNFFFALLNRPMPSYDVTKGVACPQCVAGVEPSPHH